MAEYDFFATIREELNQLKREVDGVGVSDEVHALASAHGVSAQIAFAAMWRASKRHGQSLEAFAKEMRDQHERERATTGDS